MTIRTIALASAAGAAMGFAVALGAAPAFASEGYAGNPPQYSSPAEKAETQRLNEQAAGGTAATPAELNGEGSSEVPASSQAAATQGVYEERQQQYDAQRQDYQEQQQNYEDQRAQYEHDLRRYDRAQWAYEDYPARSYAYRYDDGRVQRLYMIANPSEQLVQRPVEGPGGAWVGKVRNVEVAPDGRPARVEVALNRRVSVWVAPGHLRYDPADGVVMTDLSRDDLWAMPGATVESD